MNAIQNIQLQDEAFKIVRFDAKSRKCGGNDLKRKCNCYGLTLKYLFSMKGLTYKEVGDKLGMTAQSVNHLVNRASERSFDNEFYMQSLCRALNIDYQYFLDLCEEVRRVM